MSELRLQKTFFDASELEPLTESGQGYFGRRFRDMILRKLMAKACNFAVCNPQQRYQPP